MIRTKENDPGHDLGSRNNFHNKANADIRNHQNAEADNGPKGGKLSSPASEMMSEKQDSERSRPCRW